MYYVGIDLGGTNIAAGIVTKDYKIIAKDSVPTLPNRDPELIIKDMGALRQAPCESKHFIRRVISAGIATPAPPTATPATANTQTTCRFAFPLADTLKKYTKFKSVRIERRRAAAWGGQRAPRRALTTRYYNPRNRCRRRYHHRPQGLLRFQLRRRRTRPMVIQYQGAQCTCGLKGCWEAYSSATGLIRMTKERMNANPDSSMWKWCGGDISKVNGRTAFACMQNDGDEAAKEVVDEYIGYLACGLINIINIFQPEILSIGGGISKEGEKLMAPLREHIKAATYGGADSYIKPTKVVVASLGNDAGIIGGAVLGV